LPTRQTQKKNSYTYQIKQIFQILPDDISEHEGFIVRNRDYEKPATKRFLLQQQRSPNTIHRHIRMSKHENLPALMPFVLKESDI
jgi:hypothetical protein